MKIGSSVISRQPSAPVGGGGQPLAYDKQSSSFGKSFEASMAHQQSSSTGNSGAAVDALIRLGASARADRVDLSGEWRSVVHQLSDADRDGRITQAELQQAVAAGGGTEADANALYDFLASIQSPDSDGGALTVDDVKRGLASSSRSGGFKTVLNDFLDRNGDGEISADELDALFDVLRKAGTALD